MIKYSQSVINNRLTSTNTDIGAGARIRIYSGPRPANVGTAISAQVLLAELTGNATAFGTVASGALTANAIASDTAADATGTATWFRVFKADGATACIDGDVGAAGADLNLSSVSLNAGQVVGITSFVITGGGA